MSTSNSPYSTLPQTKFWRPSIAEKHAFDWDDLWQVPTLQASDKIATAGSCFAQHIARNLKIRGASFIDLEPPPPFLDSSMLNQFGYGLYSCRFGNIYTVRQLLQLMQESMSERTPHDYIWQRGQRFFDALRPSVDPDGHASESDVAFMRGFHLRKVKQLWTEFDIFIFTLGLTEAWVSTIDGTVYPTAPGTISGSYSAQYRFHNFSYNEVYADLNEFWSRVLVMNPQARLILTVSPVPLTATASNEHVLVASSYSKSVLRAVAGDFATTSARVSYFPSYEIISSHPTRAMFFNHDLRTVNHAGVELVMRHFFKGLEKIKNIQSERDLPDEFCNPNLICEEGLIEKDT